MSNLFYDLPEDIQLKIIMMNPHPVAEIMETIYDDVDYYDDNPINRRLLENIGGDLTIEIFKIRKKHKYNKHYLFLDKHGDTYAIVKTLQYCEDEDLFRIFGSSEE